MILDIGDQKPNSIEYHGPIGWAPTYKTDATVNSITPGIPFDGMKTEISSSQTSNQEIMGMNAKSTTDGTVKMSFGRTDDPNMIKVTSVSSLIATASLSTGESFTQNITDETSSIINLNTDLSANGSSAGFLPKNMTKNGDSFTIDNSTITIVGSEKIDILGHKLDCWKVEATSDSQGTKMKTIMYFDKTTRMFIKFVIDKQNMETSGTSLQVQGGGELVSTNAPLIGVA